MVINKNIALFLIMKLFTLAWGSDRNFISCFMMQGTLKGFDQVINLVLDESHERVFSTVSGVDQVILGLYIIRGDNV